MPFNTSHGQVKGSTAPKNKNMGSVQFKLAVLVYKSLYLYGLAPQYFVDDCELVAAADRRHLRSTLGVKDVFDWLTST